MEHSLNNQFMNRARLILIVSIALSLLACAKYEFKKVYFEPEDYSEMSSKELGVFFNSSALLLGLANRINLNDELKVSLRKYFEMENLDSSALAIKINETYTVRFLDNKHVYEVHFKIKDRKIEDLLTAKLIEEVIAYNSRMRPLPWNK